MIVKKKNIKYGSCSFCIRLTTDHMAYKIVYEFSRDFEGGMSVRICNKCFDELSKTIKKLK